jgi:hypothetical protein
MSPLLLPLPTSWLDVTDSLTPAESLTFFSVIGELATSMMNTELLRIPLLCEWMLYLLCKKNPYEGLLLIHNNQNAHKPRN